MTRTPQRLAATLVAALLATSCSSSGSGPAPDGGGGGGCSSAAECGTDQICDPKTGACVVKLTCSTHPECGKAAYCAPEGQCARSKLGSPCATADNCLSGQTCIGGFCGCKGQSYSAQNVPANVLIVLDRSGSMTETVGGQTKWSIAVAAVQNLLTSQAGKIFFGLAAYPGADRNCTTGGQCGAGNVIVDVSPTSTQDISSFLTGARTCTTAFHTPLGATLTALKGYTGLQDSARANYVLVLTDGKENCGGDPPTAAAALLAQTVPVKTFAVGFGGQVDANELNNVAQKGGTPRAGGPPYYYVASDAASLAAAFATIAGQVLSCIYTLSEKPKDPSQLYVYQSKQAVARDTTHANGWDYDANTSQLTFYGPPCQALRSGQVSDLAIVYGCPLSIQ
jgi:hypothetical protein